MPSWDSSQYLRFGSQRTRPCRELVQAIPLGSPARIIDLGCGPGNSTQVLRERWADADITGLDSSAAMIEAARSAAPDRRWVLGDISSWSAERGEPYDLVFSNAALQWVGDHAQMLAALLSRVAPGGALAFQVPVRTPGAPGPVHIPGAPPPGPVHIPGAPPPGPVSIEAPAHHAMREVALSDSFRRFFDRLPVEWLSHPPEVYFDLLAPVAREVDIWVTTYHHVLDGVDGIVEWYRGTGLRPFLDALAPEEQPRFISAYRERLAQMFPVRAGGKVLFPFERLFVIALP